MSRRTRQGIEAAIYIAINQKSDLQLGWKVLKSAAVTAEVIQAITNFVNQTKISISGRTFRPEKYTDPKGVRLFTLLPVYSFHPRYIQIDGTVLGKLLVDAGLETQQNCADDDMTSRRFWQYLDMTRIGMQTFEDLNTDRQKFWYVSIPC